MTSNITIVSLRVDAASSWIRPALSIRPLHLNIPPSRKTANTAGTCLKWSNNLSGGPSIRTTNQPKHGKATPANTCFLAQVDSLERPPEPDSLSRTISNAQNLSLRFLELPDVMNDTSQTMSPKTVKILLVEDDKSYADQFENIVRSIDQISFEIIWVTRARAAIEKLENHAYHVVMLDLGLPDADNLGSTRFITFCRIQYANCHFNPVTTIRTWPPRLWPEAPRIFSSRMKLPPNS